MKRTILKKHLRYLIPEVRLALIKEPGTPHVVRSPDDVERLIEPMKHYPDFVPCHDM
jgi:hypothetical protein